MAERKQIFRQKSLDKLSSPDQLDQMLQVVKPQSWLILWAFGIGIVLLVIWSIVGTIPITVSGSAILVRPKQIVPLQSPSDGTVSEIAVNVGDLVKKGEVIVRLRLPTLEKEFEEEQAKLKQFLEELSREMANLAAESATEQRQLIQDRRDRIEKRIEVLAKSANEIKASSERYIEEQRANIANASELSAELGERLETRADKYEGKKGGVVSEVAADEAFRDAIEIKLRVAELEVKREELAHAEILANEAYNEKNDRLRDLELQLHDLEMQERAIARELKERQLRDKNEAQRIQSNIKILETRRDSAAQLLSQYDGRVLEITASVGQLLTTGQRFGKLEAADESKKLQTVAYFHLKDGKKVRPDLRMRISPSTVQRERYGSMIGNVISVTNYAVTTDAAASQIGDLEIARSLLQGENRIEVVADLDGDSSTPTGYAWTSGNGPDDVRITAGTTASVRVTIDDRRPIELILPFLRSLTGS